jgi:hypothetical protein
VVIECAHKARVFLPSGAILRQKET